MRPPDLPRRGAWVRRDRPDVGKRIDTMTTRTRRRPLRVEGLESRSLLTTFYVSNAGSDAGPGTAGSPYATLQMAVDAVGPGDQVQVAAGTYAGFRAETSGTAAAPISLAAAPGARVVVDRPGPKNKHASDIELESFGGRVDRWTLKGLEVVAAPRAGIDVRNGNFDSVLGCYCHDNQVWGIFTAFTDDLSLVGNHCSYSVQQHGIYISNSSDRARVLSNEVDHNHDSGIQINADASQGGDGISTGCLIVANNVHDNGTGGGAALNFDGLQGSVILGNRLTNNHASGLVLYRADAAAGSSGNLVLTNTIVMAPGSRWAVNISNLSTGNKILGNTILAAPGSYGCIATDPGSLDHFVSDRNTFSPDPVFSILGGDGPRITLAAWRKATGQDLHSTTN